MVERIPAGVTRRIREPATSAIYRLPSISTATPPGPLSVACVAAPPSPRKPKVPSPAKVVVKPALVRIESHATATVSVATIGFDEAALEAFARRDVANLLASGHRYPNLDDHRRNVEYDVDRIAYGLRHHPFVRRPLRVEGQWVVVPFQLKPRPQTGDRT